MIRRTLSLVVFGLLLVPGSWLLFRAATWPDVAALAQENPQTTAFLERYRARAAKDPKLPKPRRKPVPYGRISNELKHAVIVAEDIDFFSHRGFDWDELGTAVRESLEKDEAPRGASTISQQLVKNLWLSPSRNPLRKLEEALLTRELERHLKKRRILELYLNVVEFGPGVWGAEAAARRYFGKSAAALGPKEAAALAAGLPRPSSWHPGVQTRGYLRRVNLIQRRMAQSAWVRKEL